MLRIKAYLFPAFLALLLLCSSSCYGWYYVKHEAPFLHARPLPYRVKVIIENDEKEINQNNVAKNVVEVLKKKDVFLEVGLSPQLSNYTHILKLTVTGDSYTSWKLSLMGIVDLTSVISLGWLPLWLNENIESNFSAVLLDQSGMFVGQSTGHVQNDVDYLYQCGGAVPFILIPYCLGDYPAPKQERKETDEKGAAALQDIHAAAIAQAISAELLH